MKTVFFDVDTQLDFLFPAGALYVPGAEAIAPSLASLTSFAAANDIPVISTVDSHTEDDPEFQTWKPHCVIGTQGHQKYSGTVLGSGSKLQTIVPKKTIDVFANEHLQHVVSGIAADRYVVYGLVTEYCVRTAVAGLLHRGARVDVVTDAIRSLDAEAGQSTLQRFSEQGVNLITVQDVLDSKNK